MRASALKPLVGFMQRVQSEFFYPQIAARLVKRFQSKSQNCLRLPEDIFGANRLNALTTGATEPGK